MVPAGMVKCVSQNSGSTVQLFWKLALSRYENLSSFVANRDAGLVGAKCLVGLVPAEGTGNASVCLVVILNFSGIRVDGQQHAASRIAGIGRREWTVEKIDPLDFLRRSEAPARRAYGVVVGDQRAQQDIVGIDKAPRRWRQGPRCVSLGTGWVSPLLRLRTNRALVDTSPASSVSTTLTFC